jgi:membrane-associated phospholipid phosphatase
MPLDEVLRDTTALGGLAVYGIASLFFLLAGNVGVFVQLVAGLVLLSFVTAIVRLLFFRKRPDRQGYRSLIGRIDASSFPSIHATRATVLAIVLAQFFVQPLVRLLLVLCVLAVAITRVLLRRHYVTDVVGGLVVGGLVGWLTLVIAPFVFSVLGLA